MLKESCKCAEKSVNVEKEVQDIQDEITRLENAKKGRGASWESTATRDFVIERHHFLWEVRSMHGARQHRDR